MNIFLSVCFRQKLLHRSKNTYRCQKAINIKFGHNNVNISEKYFYKLENYENSGH